MSLSLFTWTEFTVTIADPAVFTATGHGLHEDDELILDTTDSLPTGLTAKTVTYYVIPIGFTADTFRLSTTKGSTTGLVTTGTQAGTHTFLKRNVARIRPLVEDNK